MWFIRHDSISTLLDSRNCRQSLNGAPGGGTHDTIGNIFHCNHHKCFSYSILLWGVENTFTSSTDHKSNRSDQDPGAKGVTRLRWWTRKSWFWHNCCVALGYGLSYHVFGTSKRWLCGCWLVHRRRLPPGWFGFIYSCSLWHPPAQNSGMFCLNPGFRVSGSGGPVKWVIARKLACVWCLGVLEIEHRHFGCWTSLGLWQTSHHWKRCWPACRDQASIEKTVLC